MGSMVEINDTLQLTREQGFPQELDLEQYVKNPTELMGVVGRTFEFADKPDVRVFQQVPVRVFLVENRGGKWIYWGLAHILKVTQDYERQVTSGQFRVVKLFTPEQMRQAHDLIDGRDEMNYFGKN